MTQTDLFSGLGAASFSVAQTALHREIETLYRKSIALDPENILVKGNLAAFLLASAPRLSAQLTAHAESIKIEALRLLDTVLYGSGDIKEKNAALALELWFYTLCYSQHAPKFAEALRSSFDLPFFYQKLTLANLDIKALMRRKVRSPGWDLTMHLGNLRYNALASAEAQWIATLADVITLKKSILLLQHWPRWQQASADRLERSPVKNSTGSAQFNIGTVLQPAPSKQKASDSGQLLSKLPTTMLSKTYSARAASTGRLAGSTHSLSSSSDKSRDSPDSPLSRVESPVQDPLNTSIEDDAALLAEAAFAPASQFLEMPPLAKQISATFDDALTSSQPVLIAPDSLAQDTLPSFNSIASLRRQSLIYSQQSSQSRRGSLEPRRQASQSSVAIGPRAENHQVEDRQAAVPSKGSMKTYAKKK